MDEKAHLKFVFDLDGTIAYYGRSVSLEVAAAINALGPVTIISGGQASHIRNATSHIKRKTIISMADFPGNHRIDCAAMLNVTKDRFGKTTAHQQARRNLCLQLRKIHGRNVYVGGRSTIDIMLAMNKAHALKALYPHQPVIYFYDCEHYLNNDIHNDTPILDIAQVAVKTSPVTIIQDIKKWQKKFT